MVPSHQILERLVHRRTCLRHTMTYQPIVPRKTFISISALAGLGFARNYEVFRADGPLIDSTLTTVSVGLLDRKAIGCMEVERGLCVPSPHLKIQRSGYFVTVTAFALCLQAIG